MPMQFDFHLIGANAPEGELPAEQLLELVESVKELATKIGRVETRAEPVGRAPRRTLQVARLSIGLTAGSTTVRVRRAGVVDALDFESEEEQTIDADFMAVIEAVARNERPGWIGDSIARAAAHVVNALQASAQQVQFVVDGVTRAEFSTAAVDRSVWQAPLRAGNQEMTFVGRLYSANLRTHRFAIQDALGARLELPAVNDDDFAGALLGREVVAVGMPEYDEFGLLVALRHAAITLAPPAIKDGGVPGAVPLERILGSSTGADGETGIELTDEEFASFLNAVRG